MGDYAESGFDNSIQRGLLVGLAWLLISAPPLWSENNRRWSVGGYGVGLSPSGDQVTFVSSPQPGLEERATHSVSDDGTGFGLSVEYRPTRRVSVELGALSVDIDNDFRVESAGVLLTDVEAVGVESYMIGVDWHLTPERRADIQVGLFVAQTEFADVIFLTEAGRRDKLTFDDDHGVGIKLGVDWPFRVESPWFLSADLRYLSTLMESEIQGQDLDFDPLILAIGVGVRFGSGGKK